MQEMTKVARQTTGKEYNTTIIAETKGDLAYIPIPHCLFAIPLSGAQGAEVCSVSGHVERPMGEKSWRICETYPPR